MLNWKNGASRLVLAMKSIIYGDVSAATSNLSEFFDKPYSDLDVQFRDEMKALFLDADGSHREDHAVRYRASLDAVKALRRYAEDPLHQAANMPCHANLVKKEFCERCSSAVFAWTIMNRHLLLIEDYEREDWFLFSASMDSANGTGYWSRDYGWVEITDAPYYSASEIVAMHLPDDVTDVKWVRKSLAMALNNSAFITSKPIN